MPDDDRRNDPLKHSRFKRMPKVWRLGQDAPRAVDPLGDEFRVTVFLKNRQADRAEREAVESGLGDLQAWCQATLRAIIDGLDDSGHMPGAFYPVVRHKPTVSAAELEAELDIPDDPQFLREWAGIEDPQPALPGPLPEEIHGEWMHDGTPEAAATFDEASLDAGSDTIETQGDAFLSALREGRRPSGDETERLARHIERYAEEVSAEETLDRRVAKSLYRLSLEAQVLITEVHPSLGLDLMVVTGVRRIQAAVGAVLDR